MDKQRFSCRGYRRVIVLSLAFLLFGNSLLNAQQNASGRPFEIFPLKHISVEQGRKYLTDAGVGTVSHISGTSALLVTAQPDNLVKARAILSVVDGPGRFTIGAIFPASLAGNIPSNELIADKVGDISIGSFSNPPTGSKSKAIIDTHNGVVVIVAPVDMKNRIVSVIRQLSGSADGAAKTPLETTDQWKIPKVSGVDVPGAGYSITPERVSTQPNTVANVLKQRVSEIPAVRSYETDPVPNGEDTLQLSLPDSLSIQEFLGFAGEHLNLTYLYDPDKVKGNVTLRPHGRLRGPIKLKELYPLLESVLQFHGFAMTRRGNLVTIVPADEAQKIDPDLYPDAKSIEVGDAVITSVFKLKHIDTTSAKNLLDQMKLSIDVRPIEESQTLIITGYAYRMSRIETLLDMVDKPGQLKKFRFRQLQYTMAETLAPKIQTLAEQLGTVSVTIGAAEPEPYKPSTRRSGESTAAYNARVRSERAAAARRAAQAATAEAKPGGKPAVFLDADERTNRILMIGLDEQLDEVEELIDTLDVAQQDLRMLELYKIRYVDAEDAKNKLAELGVISISQMRTAYSPYSSRITEGTAASAPASGVRTSRPPAITAKSLTAGEESDSVAGEPQVVVIEPTNSLLVNATAEQHNQIVRILSYVDSEMQEEEIPYKVYPLENQSPEHLKELLMPFIERVVTDAEGKIVQGASQKKDEDDEVEIVSDPNTFSLIVYGSKRNQDWIASLIEKLDQKRPQVLIDVTLVQISKTDAFDYDLNVLSSFPDLVNTSGVTGALLPGIEAGASNLVSSLLESGRDRFIDFQSKGGVGTGFYGDKHINFLLTAMQQKDYGRVLAKPKILVNDNEPGTISTTDTTYVTKTTGAVVEGSTGVVQTGVDYQGYDAGITLEIVPHISRGGWLRLDITLTRSDFGTITGERPPDTVSSDIDTTVTVPDGSTIILGGLLKLNQSKGGTKVPLLGDIPILGGLFRSTSNSDIQRNLYVFVKAEIIRSDEDGVEWTDLQRISNRNREAFESHEVEFQNYHDWPGVKPKTMEPLRVLDAQ